MQTLDRPILHVPDLSTPSCEQVLPGNVPPDEEDIGGSGPAPKPLQGGAESEEADQRTGNEGAET